MSTHYAMCAWCQRPVSCNDEEHVFGSGTGGCYEKGVSIEFCSASCFVALRDSMATRECIARELVHSEVSQLPDLLAAATMPPDRYKTNGPTLTSAYAAKDLIADVDRDSTLLLRVGILHDEEAHRLAYFIIQNVAACDAMDLALDEAVKAHEHLGRAIETARERDAERIARGEA